MVFVRVSYLEGERMLFSVRAASATHLARARAAVEPALLGRRVFTVPVNGERKRPLWHPRFAHADGQRQLDALAAVVAARPEGGGVGACALADARRHEVRVWAASDEKCALLEVTVLAMHATLEGPHLGLPLAPAELRCLLHA
eukprot:CAMPEP_0179984132 /NCGR_PEP_ID=MMETSP0984-20121128/967_1 /TAXON_ID=483367 /ORGANISM="non described non described, Strain CCMP 2436" /LENGTH=142 /DNA_ID=CAMNT_0021902693 /DNA_START=322 /DNA_END=747 /DNA_ORIENTATION=+